MTLTTRASLAGLYRNVRGSRYFLFFLCLFCATWVYADAYYRFDPDYGLYNTILSTEASISTCVLLMFMERADAAMNELLLTLKSLLERVLNLTDALHSHILRRQPEVDAEMITRLRRLEEKIDAITCSRAVGGQPAGDRPGPGGGVVS